MNYLISTKNAPSKGNFRNIGFNKFINNNGLIDIAYLDAPFTWCNKRAAFNAIFDRLDQVLENGHWLLISFSLVNNLSISRSEHAPILLNLSPTDIPLCLKNFKFEASQ